MLFYEYIWYFVFFFFSSRRRHTRYWRDWSSDVCSSDLRLRLVRERGRGSRQSISVRRAAHQEAVLLLERPARPYDHGRGGLSRPSKRRRLLEDRSRARPADRGAYSFALRHPADLRLARRRNRRQRPHWDRSGQPVHPHDRDVRRRLAEGQGRPRTGLDRLPHRDEHAPRHAADHQDAADGDGALAELGRRSHDDGGLLHPDARRDEPATPGREPDDPRQAQREPEPSRPAELGAPANRGNVDRHGLPLLADAA